MNLNYLYIFLRFLTVLLIVIVGIIAFYYVTQLTIPFVIAIIFAFLMNPLVNLFNRSMKMPRGLSVFIALVMIFGFIAGIVTLLVTEMISGFTYLTNVVPDKANWFANFVEGFLQTKVMPLYNDIMGMFHSLNDSQQQTIMDNIQKIGTKLTGTLSEMGQGIVSGLTGFISALPNLFAIFVFALLGTFFISKDWYKFGERMEHVIPVQVYESIGHVYRDLKKALLGFLRAQLTLISMTAAINLVGLLLFHVDYAFTIAIVTGIVDLLPYLGTGAVFVPWIIYLFFTGDYTMTIELSALYAATIIQRQLMEPKIISSNIGLDPLATLIAIFVGMQLFGFIGLIIGPVMLVILKTLHEANVFRDIWRFIMGKKPA